MKATIVECMIGVFGFGEANELIDKVLFPRDPVGIAERLEDVETGKIVDEISLLVQKLEDKGFTLFVFERPEMARKAHEKLGIKVDVKRPSQAGELLRRNLDKIAVETRFVKQVSEVPEWIHRISIALTKIRVGKAVEKRDLIVVQTIQIIDDLDKTLNLFIGRIREWYGLHFPEINRLVEKHETYARLVSNLGRRSNFSIQNLETEGFPREKGEQVAETVRTSMGAELNEEDIDQIKAMCKNMLSLYNLRRNLEKYTVSVMGEIAPNLHALAGPLVGARLIALAGGLRNLAKMPASTIQILGAEKALFRALRTGSRSPKHGIIFQHSLIHEAKRWQRGKLARALAGKLAIAARTDAFSGKYMGEELKGALDRRVKEIQEKYRELPTKRSPRRRRHVHKG